jgi:hypothetical protein
LPELLSGRSKIAPKLVDCRVSMADVRLLDELLIYLQFGTCNTPSRSPQVSLYFSSSALKFRHRS